MTPNVLMFCPQYAPLTGGTERQAEKLSRALVHAGCKVTVLTPRLRRETLPTEAVDGVEVIRFPMLDLSRLAPIRGIGLANVPALQFQIERALTPHLATTDVLHAHGASLLSALAVNAASKQGVPSICKVAVSTPTELHLLSRMPFIGPSIARRFASQVAHWVAISEQIAAELSDLTTSVDQIISIPNGVEQQEGRANRGSVEKFLYVGRLSTNINRDVPTLLRAFSSLATARPHLQLALVGGGDLLDKTRHLARSLPSSNNVRIVDFDDPQKWFHWADAFILPSIQEGLSNALLEAMANGLPCIANDIPANREALDGGRAGLLTPVGDVEALVMNMERLVVEKTLAPTLSEAARKRIEQVYDMTKISGQFLALYRQLSKESPPLR